MLLNPVQNGRASDSRSLTPIRSVPPVKEKDQPDPNRANPRLLINRALIYERRLPGDAYITAHVQRLQHGYYSNNAVSDKDAEHVDFLAIAFTFHSPHTITHRIKSATISVSVRGNRDLSTSKSYPYGCPPGNPRFLMHAPHLLYGTVSPETMEWTFSLAGSLGISELPISASVIPSGSINSRYKRYEMMRIQGSARTLKNPAGREFDVEAGKIVWSMEENNVQRSGLPREFTFVMLIQKPAANSKISLSIDVDPVIDAMIGSYPSLMLKLSEYQPLPRRSVNFQQEIGQRFEPADPVRGFNFAELGSMFDEYIAMPGRKFSRQIQLPPETGIPDDHFQTTYPGQYGPLNPIPYHQLQTHDLTLQNDLLQTTLQNLWTTQVRGEESQFRPQQASPQTQDQNQTQDHSSSHPAPTTPSIPQTAAITIPLNLRLLLDPTITHLTNLTRTSPGPSPLHPRRTPSLRRTQAREFPTRMTSGASNNISTCPFPSPTASMITHTGVRSQRGGTLSEIYEGNGSGGEEEYQSLRRPPRRVTRRYSVSASSGARRVRAGGSHRGYKYG
ncbi:hypothetical protein N7491_003904 [Penicillium cf. griseofulvum]|uniref:Uncharacterized protein n=1 Tax=Penicillium cf. griseofulvum TaxID=2972120 RepID=A0A9W9MQA7_9EURO|nr:hypothetical protein N7472_001918 [Penicillium cf. griseofulvum]KAJ5437351.1 hypothetical protein N7445_005895 [Penicillium cf. griseofulvum]KAJ5441498.1 hypothetical protein N7491_003904 [Penicillium cf. griseofulvum]